MANYFDTKNWKFLGRSEERRAIREDYYFEHLFEYHFVIARDVDFGWSDPSNDERNVEQGIQLRDALIEGLKEGERINHSWRTSFGTCIILRKDTITIREWYNWTPDPIIFNWHWWQSKGFDKRTVLVQH